MNEPRTRTGGSRARVMIVAGEASGDLHGGNLVRAARARGLPIDFFGVGGSEMRDVGVEILVDTRQMETMGVELKKLGRIGRVFLRLRRILRESPPDAVVLIDYAEFNMALAGVAKRAGVKVVFYIAPQVWAWRRGRARKIAARTDRILSIIPFEPEFYASLGTRVDFVGHPLVDKVAPEADPASVAATLGVTDRAPKILLMPGSRRHEIDMVLPAMAGAAEILRGRYPNACFLLPLASTLDARTVQSRLPAGLPIHLVTKHRYAAMSLADVGLVTSGTATLEAALLGIPMAIVYRAPRFQFNLARPLLATRTYGLVNLIAGRRVCPELFQEDCRPEILAEHVIAMLEDSGTRDRVLAGLAEVRERLGHGGASDHAAQSLAEVLGLEPFTADGVRS